jgi:hypothetical protein
MKSGGCTQRLRSASFIPHKTAMGSLAARVAIDAESVVSISSTADVWTLVAPSADSSRATRDYPVDSDRTY